MAAGAWTVGSVANIPRVSYAADEFNFLTAANAFAALKAGSLTVTGAGNFATLTVGGHAPWTAGNFDPATKAAAVHTHAAGDVTSGVFNVLRIPDLAMAKITGLATALAAKLDTASFTWANLPGKPAKATSAQFLAANTDQPLHSDAPWAAAGFVAIAQAATLAVNLAAGINFSTTMTGNRTLGAPSNAKPGQSGVIVFTQDATGNRTLAFDAAWKFPLGLDPALTTTAGARDVLCYTVIAPGDVVASLLKDVK